MECVVKHCFEIGLFLYFFLSGGLSYFLHVFFFSDG